MGGNCKGNGKTKRCSSKSSSLNQTQVKATNRDIKATRKAKDKKISSIQRTVKKADKVIAKSSKKRASANNAAKQQQRKSAVSSARKSMSSAKKQSSAKSKMASKVSKTYNKTESKMSCSKVGTCPSDRNYGSISKTPRRVTKQQQRLTRKK